MRKKERKKEEACKEMKMEREKDGEELKNYRMNRIEKYRMQKSAVVREVPSHTEYCTVSLTGIDSISVPSLRKMLSSLLPPFATYSFGR